MKYLVLLDGTDKKLQERDFWENLLVFHLISCKDIIFRLEQFCIFIWFANFC